MFLQEEAKFDWIKDMTFYNFARNNSRFFVATIVKVKNLSQINEKTTTVRTPDTTGKLTQETLHPAISKK